MISHIYKGIYISGSRAVREQDAVRDLGIRAVLRVDSLNRLEGQWDQSFTLLDMPFHDGFAIEPALITRATRFIHEQLQADKKVLVHCHMGVSRSVTLVLAYLIEYEKMTLPQAYRTILAGRSIAYPHSALLGSLVEHYGLPYDQADIRQPFFLDSLREHG